MRAARLLGAVRWAPFAAAFVYLFVLVRRLPEIVDQLTWNADYVSQMAIAEWVATNGLPRHGIVVQLGYLWFDLATHALPSHLMVWEYAPSLMAALTVTALAWTAWRLVGRFAAALAAAISLAASPLTLSTEVAQAYHGSTWFGTALLGAYLCWVLTARVSRRALVAVSILVGVAMGFATASDPLLGPAGDAPLAAALLLAWRARPDDVTGRHVAAGGVMTLTALLTAAATVLGGRGLGFTSSFPRGLTHFVTRAHLSGNLRQLASGIFEVAGDEHGTALGLVLGVILALAIVFLMVWLVRAARGSAPAPLVAVLGFWSASALLVAAAFVFSDIPADFVQTSARYLVSMFFAAGATVPLWAGAGPGRGALVGAPAALLILANAAAIEADARSGAFEPSFSFALDAPISFLQTHGLRHGYAAYDEASPMSLKTDFGLQVYPVTEWFVTEGDTCGPPPQGSICPYAYNSLSAWYGGRRGPTFILVDTYMNRLSQPPPPALDQVAEIHRFGRFTIYVYADDVAAHMGTPLRFKRALI